MNRLAFTTALALRYAGFRGHESLSRFISRLAMAGFVIGVAVLITVLSVMNGFERELRERILKVIPAVVVSTREPVHDWQPLVAEIRRNPQVTAATPFIEANALVSRGNDALGAMLYGVDAALEKNDSPYQAFLDGPGLAGLLDHPDGLFMGAGLAAKLDLKVGDSVNVMVARYSVREGVHVQRFTLIGLLKTGTELDHHLMVSSLDAASVLKLGEPGLAEGIRIRVKDVLQAPQTAFDLYRQFDGRYGVNDWTSTQGNLYEAIHMSKRLVTLVLLVLVLVAGFNVISGLFLLVNEKRADIAILKTMGLSPGRTLAIFALQGTIVGVVGVFLGMLLGVALSYSLPTIVAALERLLGFTFLSSEIYPVSFLPSELQWQDVFAVVAASLCISATVSLYPAWRAAAVMPAESLRQE